LPDYLAGLIIELCDQIITGNDLGLDSVLQLAFQLGNMFNAQTVSHTQPAEHERD